MAKVAEVLADELGEAFVADLARFKQGEIGPVMLFENMPTPRPMPDTPFHGFGSDAEVLLADAILLGLYKLANIMPMAYAFENAGRMMRNVVANPASFNELSSHGCRRTFPSHHDNPAQRFAFEPGPGSPIPHFLGFSGLRSTDAFGNPVTTDILTLETALAALAPEWVEALRLPGFRVEAPASNNLAAVFDEVPLLVTDPVTGNHIRYEYDICTGLTRRVTEALERFNGRLDDLDFEAVDLGPGSHLIFDNYKVPHHRVGFIPGELHRSRWLRRCYGCTDINLGIFADYLNRPYIWA